MPNFKIVNVIVYSYYININTFMSLDLIRNYVINTIFFF